MPNTSTPSTQPQKPPSSSTKQSLLLNWPSSTIQIPYKNTVTKATRSWMDNPNDDVQLSLLRGINSFCGAINSKQHLLPLIWTTTVKGTTILFTALVSHEPFNPKPILLTIHNNPSLTAYGDVGIGGSFSSCSKPYDRERIWMEKAFFAALASCPKVKALVDGDMIIHPEFPKECWEDFYILCLSPATPGKKDLVVNWAQGVSHIDFIKDGWTFAIAQYEPTTVQTKFKTMFAVFSQCDICYSFLKDFNNQGTSSWFECQMLLPTINH